jgi:hypothetical protein
MVACDLTGHDFQFLFCGNLPQQVAHTNPRQTDFQVRLRVRAQPAMSHATTLYQLRFA